MILCIFSGTEGRSKKMERKGKQTRLKNEIKTQKEDKRKELQSIIPVLISITQKIYIFSWDICKKQ